MGRILAIDYGSKRVGIAVTDPMQIIATALTTVGSHEIIPFLRDYIAKEPIDCIVVGEARNLDGSPSESAELIENFVKGLKKNFPNIAVEREDERFTSKIAFQAMIDSGLSKSKRRDKKIIDKVSAVVILQSYLERRNK